MDIATLIGLLVGFGGLLIGFTAEGGGAGMLVAGPAALIVFGGTFGATIASFTMDELKTLPGFFRMLFTDVKVNYSGTLDNLVRTADKARREGLLSLESELETVEDDFLRRGMQLVIDGTDPELTRSMLEMEIDAFEKRTKVGEEMFMAAGGYSPTMGIIGTVMGLIKVLGSLDNAEALGPAIAGAFIATLYGVCAANVLWIPFGTKIKIKSGRLSTQMEMVLEGILSIQAGENPRVIKEKLLTFLPPEEKAAAIAAEGVAM
ncbi:MAG: flagellar motor protein [Methylocystaceae bacterium]